MEYNGLITSKVLYIQVIVYVTYTFISYSKYRTESVTRTFFYKRIKLAAMHFNDKSSKPPLETKAGEKRWCVSYVKYKDSGTVKQVNSRSTYCECIF